MNSAVRAEQALIARVIVEPDLLGTMDGLEPDDFGTPDLATIYRTIRKRYQAGEAIDSVLVGEECGVEVDVLELSPASFAPIDTYVKVIKEAAVRRRLLSIVDNARSQLVAGSGDALDTVSKAVEDIVSVRGVTGVRRASEVIRSYRNDLHRRETSSDGIPYGIPSLDDALLPMRAGRLVVFASRPGIGKTALAESVSDNASKYGPVLFVSLEMTAEELTDRAMARMSGHSAKDIMRGKVGVDKLDAHLKARSDAPIIYVDDGTTTTSDILSAAQKTRMMHDGKLGLVVVDYLQLVADKQGGDNEVYRVGAISHALKRMAMKLKVPVLALAQLNRAIESEGRKPRLSDLRDSGAIEQDADVVVILQGNASKPERALHILKQRQGSTGELHMLFDGDTQTWNAPAVAASRW